MDAVVERRGGYMYVSDLEAIVGEATGATVVAVTTRPDTGTGTGTGPGTGTGTGPGPVLVAWLVGPTVADEALAGALHAALPTPLVPDVIAVVDRLPADPARAPLPPEARWLRPRTPQESP
jgi:hypothetical protein